MMPQKDQHLILYCVDCCSVVSLHYSSTDDSIVIHSELIIGAQTDLSSR